MNYFNCFQQPFDPPRCVRKLVLLQNDRELHEMLNDKDVQSYLTKVVP